MATTAEISKPVEKYETSSSDRSSSPSTPNHVVTELYDRLASYMDGMRCLENENTRLNDLVRTSAKSSNREMDNIKQAYEDQLLTTTKMADESSLEKAKLELDVSRMFEEIKDWKQKYDNKNKENLILEESARFNEAKYKETINSYNATVAENRKIILNAENVKLESIKLRNQMEECRKAMEKETVARVESENTVRSLREVIKLKDEIHNSTLNESLAHRQVESLELNDYSVDEQYKSKFQESLLELRDQYEEQMRSNMEEIELLFESKVKNDRNAVQRDNETLNSTLQYLCSRIELMNGRNGELEENNSLLNNQIRDLQLQLDGEKALIAEKGAEINRLRSEITLQLQKYQDLLDIKANLDLDFAACGKLLCLPSNSGSGKRLSNSHPVRGSPAAKRNRSEPLEVVYSFAFTSSSTGDVDIIQLDPAVKCVKLHNKAEHEISLDGWQLILKSGEIEIFYKFNCSDKIDGGADLIIWSADSGVSSTPGNIIMESQNWCLAQEMKSTLVDGNGKEVAKAERARRLRLPLHRPVQQQNGPAPQKKKCMIM